MSELPYTYNDFEIVIENLKSFIKSISQPISAIN